jgi:bicarbonate transport system ATP-binding protein
VNVFSTAARELGIDVQYKRTGINLFDGVKFDDENPLDYLNNLKIKRNVTMAEIILDTRERDPLSA